MRFSELIDPLSVIAKAHRENVKNSFLVTVLFVRKFQVRGFYMQQRADKSTVLNIAAEQRVEAQINIADREWRD